MRSSLYSKIVPWFFLSLGISVALLFLLFRIDFRIKPGLPFDDLRGEPIINLAWQISGELSGIPETDRERRLATYASSYDVDLYFFDGNGHRRLGPPVFLPPEIKRALHDPVGIRPPPQRNAQEDSQSETRQLHKRPGPAEQSSPRFTLTTKDPTRYWVGVRLPFKTREGTAEPLVFLAASDSITGHGLFWDPLPWVLAIALFVFLNVLLWIPIIRHLTRPIRNMTHAAEEMAKGHFDVHLDEHRSDEIGRLSSSITEMAKRLNGYLSGQRRFLADISHELSSPIARAKLALSIAEPETEGKAQTRIRNALGELENMSDLVNKLLALTRAEVGTHKAQLSVVSLKAIAENAIAQEKAEDVLIELHMSEGLTALADSELLSRAIGNGIRNAVRYAGKDGPILIAARQDSENVLIEIRDQGPGVAEIELDYIFEPFYRAEESRSRKTGGVGLGLAIVKSCIEACQGKVSASNASPKGFVLRIALKANE